VCSSDLDRMLEMFKSKPKPPTRADVEDEGASK
jgi:hypothetical protein